MESETRFIKFWKLLNEECALNGLEELPYGSAKTLYEIFLREMRSEASIQRK